SPKGDDLLPTIEALRKSGFPARTIPVSGPVTMGIAHLCCGTCRTGLTKAFAAAKLESVDVDSIKVSDDTVTLNPKPGMKIDLVPMLAAMEQGGFYPNRIMATAASSAHRGGSPARRVAAR
ncbi:MAG TPA: hypothetical protein VKT77_05605, partial [Chthonomonadaceae bacterium]|nr:hypothetical protein [Chthonomonadaceae bacterium]